MSNLEVDEVFCNLCRSILFRPVRLPCQHVMCLECFEKAMVETSYSCPYCRRRVSTWARIGRKNSKLVDEVFWKQIQDQYSEEVFAKENGRDDGLDARIQAKSDMRPIITPAGQVAKEFQELIRKNEEEFRIRREKEERQSQALLQKLREEEIAMEEARKAREREEALSLELIRKLQEDEENERIQQERKSLEFIKLLQTEESAARQRRRTLPTKGAPRRSKRFAQLGIVPVASSSSLSVGPMDLYTVRIRDRTESEQNTDSRDSIGLEMTHFKPIRCVPKTPPKSVNYSNTLQHPHKYTPTKRVSDDSNEPQAPHSLIHSKRSAFYPTKGSALNEVVDSVDENSDPSDDKVLDFITLASSE